MAENGAGTAATAAPVAAARPVAAPMLGTPGSSPILADPKYEHLRWLCLRDQRVLCRSECGNAVREEGRLEADLRVAIDTHQRAVEYCRAASERDPDWFTLDVQDAHRRRAAILQTLLEALEYDAMPSPEDHAILADPFRGAVYSSFAIAAQATTLAMQDMQQDGEAAREAATSAASGIAASTRSAVDQLRRRFTAGGLASEDSSMTGAGVASSSAVNSGGYPTAVDESVALANDSTAHVSSSSAANSSAAVVSAASGLIAGALDASVVAASNTGVATGSTPNAAASAGSAASTTPALLD